jgi:hypothetical protein
MLNSIWPESNGSNKPLPAPNVVVARSGTPPDQLSPEAVKGILVNPIYTGLGPFPRLVEDAAWVRTCAKLIEEEGPQQFLVNLLFVLRECFRRNRWGHAMKVTTTYLQMFALGGMIF